MVVLCCSDRVLCQLAVKYLNPITSVCVVRCLREEQSKIQESLKRMEEIRGRRVSVKFINVSGKRKFSFLCCRVTGVEGMLSAHGRKFEVM